jgi:hypothetical protein
MEVTVTFADSDKIYTVDFLKLAKKLKLTEEQIRRTVIELVAQS